MKPQLNKNRRSKVKAEEIRYSPFFSRSGQIVHTVEDLVGLCEHHPVDGIYHLLMGDIEKWLDYIGEKNLAKQAKEAQQAPLTDSERLDLFIASCPQVTDDNVTFTEPSPEPIFEKHIEFLAEEIKKHRDRLPAQRVPTILICGKAGAGKTTTINTLFGKRVGKVGHYRRGTDKDEVYVWESATENIHIIDLPGLGDTRKKDKEYEIIYREAARKADGFIVVINPPRPAEHGTLKTVQLLLKCGISSKHIIFGFNKLSWLEYTEGEEDRKIELHGLLGIKNPRHLHAVEDAKNAFLKDLKEEFPNYAFDLDQIIEYDSKSGWNLYKLLIGVVNLLPYAVIGKFEAAAKGGQEIIEEEKAKLNERKRELARKQKEFEQEKPNLTGWARRSAEEALIKKKEELENRDKGLENIALDQGVFHNSVIVRVAYTVADVVEVMNPTKAAAIRAAGETIANAVKEVKENVKSGWEKFKKWAGWG